MRQLIEWVQEMQEPSEFLSTLRVDLYPEEVYTFTPKGRVVVLPRGATPIDFAYAVHTEVGHQCVGRESERRNGSAASRARQWRRGGNHDAEGPRAFARLALLRSHLARAQQDPAVDQPARARAGHGSGPQASRKGSARRGHQPEENHGRRLAARGLRIWLRARSRTCTPIWATANGPRGRCWPRLAGQALAGKQPKRSAQARLDRQAHAGHRRRARSWCAGTTI